MEDDVADFLIYLRSEKTAANQTIEAYHRDIHHFTVFLCGKNLKDWKEVDQEHLIEFLALKKEKKYAPASIYRALIAIKVFFKFLKREGVIASNFTHLLDTPKLWQLIPNILTIEEVDRLISQPNISTQKGARDKAILEVLYASGLRVSELCRLHLQDVDDTYIRVKGKGGKERIVPIGSKAIQAIDYYLSFREGESSQETPLFLGKKQRPIDRVTVWKMVKFYAKKARLTKIISPHTFRHSYATHLLNNGADLRVIQELLGHASVNSTDRYTQVNNKQIMEAFNAFHPRPY